VVWENVLRILHGPVNVGNQPWVLSRHERKLGHHSDLVTNFSTWLQYPADRVLGSDVVATTLGDKFTRALFAARSTLSYDVLHYYFGQSYMYRPGVVDWKWAFADLKLARALGKRVIMTLQGCDVRRAGHSNSRNAVTMCRSAGCSAFSTCIQSLDRIRQRLIDDILPLCDRVFFLNPELGHDTNCGVFMPYANVDIDEISISPPTRNSSPIVLHAPSDPSIKGTELIETALAELSSRFDFRYIPVKGLVHTEAMKLYAAADIVIDQVQAGWYGGFAVEAMAMGKPVAAYIRDEDLKFVPAAMRTELPILRVDPRTLVADLAAIFERRSEWEEFGARARAFVERWHNPSRIAAALLRCYASPAATLDFHGRIEPRMTFALQ
jgi:hypothetical protein